MKKCEHSVDSDGGKSNCRFLQRTKEPAKIVRIIVTLAGKIDLLILFLLNIYDVLQLLLE